MFSLQSEESKPVKKLDWQLVKIFVSLLEMYGFVHFVLKFTKSDRSRSVRGGTSLTEPAGLREPEVNKIEIIC